MRKLSSLAMAAGFYIPQEVEIIDESKSFPTSFQPNPGGQQALFNKLWEPEQERSVYSFLGGVASGKTFSGANFILLRALQDPHQRLLISANSYGQLETSTLVGFLEVCRSYSNVSIEPFSENLEVNAKQIARAHNCYITINGKQTFCYVLSADAFTGKTDKSKEVGRGLQIRSLWFDEGAYAEESSFTAMLTRLNRGAGTIQGLGLVTSTINRNNPFNWFWEFFDNPDRKPDRKEKFQSIRVATTENKFLDDSYIDLLRSSLTPEVFDIEVGAQYRVATEGKVFKYFDRENHVIDDPGIFSWSFHESLHISLDFNYSPTTGIVAAYRNEEILILHEFYLEDAGTFEMSRELATYLRQYRGELFVHGDATGNQRTANSRKTNWQIILDGLNNAGIKYRVCYGAQNPSVEDSTNAVNVAFMNDRIVINPQCKELIKGLISLSHEGRKKQDDHLTDCLRYLVNDILPLAIPRRPMLRSGNLGNVLT